MKWGGIQTIAEIQSSTAEELARRVCGLGIKGAEELKRAADWLEYPNWDEPEDWGEL